MRRRRAERARPDRTREPSSCVDRGERVEEGRRPVLDVIGGDDLAQPVHAVAGFGATHRDRRLDGVDEPLGIVWVDDDRLFELVDRAGELAEHEHTAAVGARGDELLGDEVHAVAQRRHEHHVRGAVEGDELGQRQAAVEVVHDRVAERGVRAVELTDELLDAMAFLRVLVHALPTRDGDLHEDELRTGIGPRCVTTGERASGEQGAHRGKPLLDALRVVQPVDAEQDDGRVAEAAAQLGCLFSRLRGPRECIDLRSVDGDREVGNDHPPSVDDQLGARLVDLGVDQTRAEPNEVLGSDASLEPDHVGPEQAVEDLVAPRQSHEQLLRRERDVQEEPDAQIRTFGPQHRRHELQLVVVDPHRRPERGHVVGGVGEALVDVAVDAPALVVERGGADRVVVQRPQRAVGDLFVVVLHLVGRQLDRLQRNAVGVDRPRRIGVRTGPAEPHAVTLAQHAEQRPREAPGARTPPRIVGNVVVALHREAVGDDDEVPLADLGTRSIQLHNEPVPRAGGIETRQRRACG